MLKYVALLAVVFGLSGCGVGQSDKTEVGLNWNPADVRISCPSGDCPDAAGVLIFVQDIYRGYQVSRCTATLTAPDTIITNAHCDDLLGAYNRAYFILPTKGGGTVVAGVVQKTYEHIGETSGIERDLAFFKLDRAMPGTPRRISRKIPAQMDKLVSYVINQSSWDDDFISFSLDKRVCRVDETMGFFGGGSADKTLGIALFDCEIKKGNSGSAVYLPDDLFNIQALVNTLWDWTSVSHQSGADKIRSLFFEMPFFMSKSYGMAERLHCADVPGQSAPEEYCSRLNVDQTVGTKFRAALGDAVDRWFANSPADSGGVVWTVVALEGKISEDSYGYIYGRSSNPGAVLVPQPYCYNGGDLLAKSFEVPYLRLGLDGKGGAEARVIQEQSMSVKFTALTNRYLGMSVDMQYLFGGKKFQPTSASQARFDALTASNLNVDLPRCSSAARTEARQRALESVQEFKVDESEFL